MSVYVYDKETTAIHKRYKTFAAARAAITRMRRVYLRSNLYVPGSNVHEDDPLFLFAIADCDYFHLMIEKRVTKRNLMTGEDYQETVNTPLCCSPATETYWSM
jgi:hypothetical protein